MNANLLFCSRKEASGVMKSNISFTPSKQSRFFRAAGRNSSVQTDEQAASAAASQEVSDANDGDARVDEVEAAMPLKGAGRRPGVEEARESRRDSSVQTDESPFFIVANYTIKSKVLIVLSYIYDKILYLRYGNIITTGIPARDSKISRKTDNSCTDGPKACRQELCPAGSEKSALVRSAE